MTCTISADKAAERIQTDEQPSSDWCISIISTETYGLILQLLSVLFFSVMGIFLKFAADTGLPSSELVFCRAVFQGLFVVLPGLCCCRAETVAQGCPGRPLICTPLGGTTAVFRIVVLRGIVGATGFCLYYFTLAALPIGDAVALLSLYPIPTIFLARLILAEPLRWQHFLVVTISVIGALCIAQPTFLFGSSRSSSRAAVDTASYNAAGYVTGLLGSCTASGVVTLIRKAGMVGAHTLQLLFSWVLFGFLFSLTLGGIQWQQQNPQQQWRIPPSVESWGYVLVMSVVGSAAHVLLNYAGRLAPAGLVSIMRSTNIVWAFVWEVTVFHQQPRNATWLGVVLIGLSLVLVAIQKIHEEGLQKNHTDHQQQQQQEEPKFMPVAVVEDFETVSETGCKSSFDGDGSNEEKGSLELHFVGREKQQKPEFVPVAVSKILRP